MTISEKVQPEKLSASILLRLDGRLIFPLKMSILLLAKYIGEPFEPFPDTSVHTYIRNVFPLSCFD